MLIVGLGNPGKQYENTRHNVGFLVLDELANRFGVEFKKKILWKSQMTQTMLNEKNIYLIKPQTYMNKSGLAVSIALSKTNIDPKNILVIYDDADLDFGEIKYKESGGSAGQKGMQSILEQFPKETKIARIRVGIGRPQNTNITLEDFVLQKWTIAEAEKLNEIISNVADLVIEKLEE